MGLFDSGSFGINLGINPGEWFGENRPDEVRAQNTADQERFAKNAIQWRVADAKAAGLHPLFGLQGNNATFTPNPVTVNDSTSVSFSPGAPSGSRSAAERRQQMEDKDAGALAERSQADSHARTISMIATDTEQQSLLRAQTDLARQQLQDSINARAGQAGRVNKERAVQRVEPVNPEDAYEIKPREVMQGSGTSGGTIAVGPPSAGFEPIWIAPGIPALVPAGAAQNLGDMEFSGWLVAAAATMAWWGDAAARPVIEAARKAGHWLFGQEVRSKAAEIMKSLPANSWDHVP